MGQEVKKRKDLHTRRHGRNCTVAQTGGIPTNPDHLTGEIPVSLPVAVSWLSLKDVMILDRNGCSCALQGL